MQIKAIIFTAKPREMIKKLLRKRFFQSQLNRYRKLDKNPRFEVRKNDLFPCLNDSTPDTVFDYHYVYHPAWACRIVKKVNPEYHIDISSTLHFCSMLSAFIPTKFYDYRPAKLTLSGLETSRADLTNLFFPSESIESLSCMHTIEHVGLGRYGDPINPDGDLLAIKELKRVIAKGGNLLFVTPIGVPRLQFNAHRIYSYQMILSYFEEFELMDFSLVLDNGNFIEGANPDLANDQKYGCGCFWFRKTKTSASLED